MYSIVYIMPTKLKKGEKIEKQTNIIWAFFFVKVVSGESGTKSVVEMNRRTN